jgi:hypothetical protein
MADARTRSSADRELELYRSILEEPTEFRSGFTWVVVAGALFCGLLMMPATIYLSLMTGGGVAANWVTLIIFSEVIRRAMKTLRKQELVLLLHVAGTMSGGGAFAEFIWRQYLVGSDAVRDVGLLGQFPSWYSPQPTSEAILTRNLFHVDWMVPVLLLAFVIVMGFLRSYTLGYFFFRLCSDVEKLPFPFAPISAQGAMALAEAGEKKASWKWRIFSLGAAIGFGWAFFAVGIPLVTGALLTRPLMLIPIPWLDLTTLTEGFLPATPFGMTIDLGLVLTGMVIPFSAVMGMGGGILLTTVLNPILHKLGVLTRWRPGMDTISTTFSNSIDFWMSFGLGVAFAIATISVYQTTRDLIKAARQRRAERKEAVASAQRQGLWAPRPGRGDFSPWLALAIYLACCMLMIVVCHRLVPLFPISFLFFFTLIYTPLLTYLDTRLTGISGQTFQIPMMKEASFILSRYKGIDIWLAPIPLEQFTGQAVGFRVSELTGTNFFSYLKAAALTIPLSFMLSWVFWAFVWHSGVIPSDNYPFVQKMWELQSKQAVLTFSATMETQGTQPLFFQALHPPVVAGGYSFSLIAFAILSALKLPVMSAYGFVQSVGGMPHTFLLLVVGAFIGKFYFRRKYGEQRFLQWLTVLLAGFATGAGLIALLGVGLRLIVNAVSASPF